MQAGASEAWRTMLRVSFLRDRSAVRPKPAPSNEHHEARSPGAPTLLPSARLFEDCHAAPVREVQGVHATPLHLIVVVTSYKSHSALHLPAARKFLGSLWGGRTGTDQYGARSDCRREISHDIPFTG